MVESQATIKSTLLMIVAMSVAHPFIECVNTLHEQFRPILQLGIHHARDLLSRGGKRASSAGFSLSGSKFRDGPVTY